MIFNIENQIIFQLQLITHPTITLKGVVVFQDPSSLIYSVHQDFMPNFVIHCVIFFLPLFKGILHRVRLQCLGKNSDEGELSHLCGTNQRPAS